MSTVSDVEIIRQLQHEIDRLLLPKSIDSSYRRTLKHIKPWHSTDVMNNASIFKMPPPTNIDRRKTYIEFLRASLQILDASNKDRTQSFIKAHAITSLSEEDMVIMSDLERRYSSIYRPSNADKGLRYAEDILSQRDILERELIPKGIIRGKIREQTDEEFWSSTIPLRITQLADCYKNDSSSEKSQFYQKAYDEESKLYDRLVQDNTLTFQQKINTFCNGINWSSETPKLGTREEIDRFLHENPNEELFLDTFIPHNPEGTDNIISRIIAYKGKPQYIYAFWNPYVDFYKRSPLNNKILTSSDIESASSGKPVCNMLVEYTPLLNTFLNRCIASNTEKVFPIRFILPEKLKHQAYWLDQPNLEYFDTDKYRFLGILIVNYLYQKNGKNERRKWLLFVFKHAKGHKYDQYGQLTSVSALTITFQPVNIGDIHTKSYTTHYEFIELIHKYRMNTYISDIDGRTCFLTRYSESELETLCESKLGLAFGRLKEICKLRHVVIPYEDADLMMYKYPFSLKKSGGGKVTLDSNRSLLDSIKLAISKSDKYIIDVKSNILDDTHSFSNYIDVNMELQRIFINNNLDFQSLYPYYPINPRAIKFLSLEELDKTYDRSNIILYKPITRHYYTYNEIIQKYKLIQNRRDISIISYGNTPSILETLLYHHYDLHNLEYIVPEYIKLKSANAEIDDLRKLKGFINFKSSIIPSKNIWEFVDHIYNNRPPANCKIVIFSMFDFLNDDIMLLDDQANFPTIYAGALLALRNLQIGGHCIIQGLSVAYKNFADLYIIIKQYFTEGHLYYPEIEHRFKRIGAFWIFKGFKGNNPNSLEQLRPHIQKCYPLGAFSFNVSDPYIREKYLISSPQPKKGNNKYVVGLLAENIDSPIYAEIKDFNAARYMEQYLYCMKLKQHTILPSREKFLYNNVVESVLYCRKWGIHIYDSYGSRKYSNAFSHKILEDMYGNTEPIKYIFHKGMKQKKKTRRAYSVLALLGASVRITKRHIATLPLKLDSGYTRQLNPLIYQSNNLFVQVGRLIDVRKDFNALQVAPPIIKNKKPLKDSPSNPDAIYDALKHRLRYYQGSGGKDRYSENLSTQVRTIVGDTRITQAWLKMYEILEECKLDIIKSHLRGVGDNNVYKSFHLCELPGTFINCLNYYIMKKRGDCNITLEWQAQSLKPEAGGLEDKYELLAKYPERWDWGISPNNGDITSIRNIIYYANKVQTNAVDLITSDCGLEWGNPKYELVAASSLVAILYMLPRGASMIYKILAPVDIPFIWNLIYLCWCNFKELIFFKPVQNSQSREFYMVGKGFNGLDDEIKTRLLEVIDNADDLKQVDLYGDIYPEAFAMQAADINMRFAQNYARSIERIIYYMDHKKHIDVETPDFMRLTDEYIQQKNIDWIKKYKISKLKHTLQL